MHGNMGGWAAAVLLALALLPTTGATAGDALRLELPRALQAAGPFGASLDRQPWLATHQAPDGHWSARDWDRWCLGLPQAFRPRPSGRAPKPFDLSTTALASVAFLSTGYTHRGKHPFAAVLSRSLRWLKRRQLPSGSFARNGDPDPRGAHALATLAMTEVFGMTASPVYRDSCLRALQHLMRLQGDNGAWQRPASTEDDVLATLWAAMCLKSVELISKDARQREREAPIPIDAKRALTRIAAWFDGRTDPTTGLVQPRNAAEVARGGTELVLTAAGALVRLLAGEDPKTSTPLRAALDYLRANPPTAQSRHPTSDGLYTYLGALVAYRAGVVMKRTWMEAIRRSVVDTQHRQGQSCDRHGSWDPRGPWEEARGRVASTAMSAIVLSSVFYRYDGVFGDAITARQRQLGATMSAARLQVLEAGRTWTRSTLPIHAARMNLARGGSLALDAAHIRAQVYGMRAQVVLDLFVTNPHADMKEGVMDLRLPEGAAPYYLAFGEAALAKVPPPGAGGTVSTDLASLQAASRGDWGHVKEARMAPVAAATNAFETIVRKRRDPALLTWSGAGVFHLRVFPLEPKKQHRIVVAYEVDLSPVGEDAELILDLPPGLHNVRVAVTAAGGLDWTAEPDAPIKNGVRTWHEPGAESIRIRIARVRDTWLVGTGAEKHLYTAAWVRPDVPEVAREPRAQAQFLIDVSKSVSAEHLQVWRELVLAILKANREDLTSFNVAFFDMHTSWWREEPVANTAENVAALEKALAALEPGGATDLAQALATARSSAKQTDVFLFTDGLSTWGATARAAVLAKVDADHSVFTYETGLGDQDRALLREVATRSGGALFTVLGRADVPAAARAHRFVPWEIESIALSNVDDLLVQGDPRRIHPGQRLRLVGRGRPHTDDGLTLNLRQGERLKSLHVPIPTPNDSPMAARTYGQAAAQRLEAAGPALSGLARDYAMHFRVVRPTSALLMLESEQDYRRFHLDQGGCGGHVQSNPVLEALATVPARMPLKAANPSLAEAARRLELPEALVNLLAAVPPERLCVPIRAEDEAPDAVLRRLGGALEDNDANAQDRRQLALHLYGRGRPAAACAVLQPLLGHWRLGPTASWILARSAARSRRPILALFGYEAALRKSWPQRHGEIPWVIGADYERYLERFLAGRKPDTAAVFAEARLASLKRWRRLLGVYAPRQQADLVVLLVPFSWRDRVAIQVEGPSGLLEPSPIWDTPASNLRQIPEGALGRGPCRTLVHGLEPGPWRVRVTRPHEDAPPENADRCLVIVIRDWGRASERIVLVRSHGPDDDPLLWRKDV